MKLSNWQYSRFLVGFFLLILLILMVVIGCARLDYVKVPTPTQYSNWTDADQRKADSMKGVRYYLPRPFLHLKKSVPVAQRVAFISFHFDPNEGAYILDQPQNPPTWLKRVVPRKISVGQALAAMLAKTRIKAAEEQAGEVGPEEAPPGVEAPAPPSTLTSTTGFINQTDPVTELSDKMDIVYLPDFEEQYVIRAETGLGEAKIETRLRNGWAAEVFSVDLDNSQVIPYVIEQVEKASEVASGIATTWLPVAAGFPPGTSPAALLELSETGEMQAGAVESDLAVRVAENVLGQVLLFKIAEVRIAQPGVYPILKPREIKQWLKFDGVVKKEDPQASFEEFLVQAKLPWIRPDMAFIPCPPFTVIGFNATTDVFLAPATDRGVMEVDSDNRAPSTLLTEQMRAIAKAMEKKKASLNADADLISQQNIVVDKNTAGNGTIITISAPPTPGVKFTSDNNTIREWVIDVFSPNGTIRLQNEVEPVSKSPDEKVVTITILVNIPDLAERARKVE